MTSQGVHPRVLAIDIATTAVRVLLVEPGGDGIAALEMAESPCSEIRSGAVANPDVLVDAIRGTVRRITPGSTGVAAYVAIPATGPHATEDFTGKSAEMVVQCCERAGLRIDDTIPAVVASGFGVATHDEMRRGVGVVDLGAGPAKFATYIDGVLKLAGTVRRGGATVSGDVALALRTPVTAAERIVIERGCALPNSAGIDDVIVVPSLGGRPIRSIGRRAVAELMHDRLREIFSDVRAWLAPTDLWNRLEAGIVLAGGLSRIPGLADLAREVLHLPIRLGAPQITGRPDLGAEHATLVGLARFAVSSGAV